METKSKGIILSVVPYQDNDNVIEVFLDDNRKLSLFAPGTRKVESKNRQSLIIGNIVEMSYFKARMDDKMSRLKSVDSLKTFLPDDQYIYDVVNKVVKLLREYKFQNNNSNVFINYNIFIDKLNSEDEYINIYFQLMGNVVLDSNSSFNFKRCVVCDLQKTIKSFSLREGGVICEEHAKSNDPIFNKNLLTYTYFMVTNNYDYLKDMKLNQTDNKKITGILNEYFREILGLYTKA